MPENAEADSHVASLHWWIGRCLFEVRKFKAGRVFFEKALEIQEKSLVNTNEAAIFPYWISRCLFEINKVDEAEVFFQKSFQIYGKASLVVAQEQRWSPRGRPWPRGRPRGHILKSLALASKPQVLGLGLEALGPRKLPCPRLEDSTIFEPLKFC